MSSAFRSLIPDPPLTQTLNLQPHTLNPNTKHQTSNPNPQVQVEKDISEKRLTPKELGYNDVFQV